MRLNTVVLNEEITQWCRGKNWVIRAPLLFYFAYAMARHVRDPLYTGILGGLNLGIHELGHVIFCFLGRDICVAGGTILQLSVPVYSFFNFYKQRDFFAVALSFGWLATNLFNVASYIADASKLELPLVSVFGQSDVYHDWNYLLGKMGILAWDKSIASGVFLFGIVSMLLCLGTGGWLLWKMAVLPREGGEYGS